MTRNPVPGVNVAHGIREIPRLCEPCDWSADYGVRPAVWTLTRPDPGCSFHKYIALASRTARAAAATEGGLAA
jgi:hypothetical protein